ncbi:hypothetical protein FGIG_09808 [Fasciola gigantica]|uniref:Uncharacterized protein n=1 Tax=Fasciola gigantica TaxID=46835 RepID=A0A504YKX4_FASGI|nr:hypothetical protein FGIG_09808 [Fasciola gigantica]
MSFDLSYPDELELPDPEWDYGLAEEVDHDEDNGDWSGTSWPISAMLGSKMHELFACSKTVLAQSFDNLAFILILCLIWRLLYMLLVSIFCTSGKRNRVPVIILHIASIIQGEENSLVSSLKPRIYVTHFRLHSNPSSLCETQ